MHVGLGPCVGPALRAAITRLAGGLRLARFLAALTPTFDTDRIEPLRDQLRAGVELPAGLDVMADSQSDFPSAGSPVSDGINPAARINPAHSLL
jgi:hypothetical protein